MTSEELPADSLIDAFWTVARRLRHGSQDALAPLGLSPSQSRGLRVLDRFGPLRPGDLASRLHIAPRSATEVVDALEQQRLVRRSPDPSDRRATLVETTEAGTQVLDELRRIRRDEADRLFAGLSRADRAELGRILALLVDGTAPPTR